jgi:hypothetical protein
MRSRPATNFRGGTKVTEEIRVYVDPRLKIAAGAAADAEGIALSEFVARALAKHLSRPDLAAIPRKASGRPRKPVPA